MINCVIVDGSVPQYKGNFHMHTGRSWDCTIPYSEALAEYRQRGYDFCAVTDHEVYWNSSECEQEDFITLPGVESAFIIDEEKPGWLLDKERLKSLHLNLLWDVTQGESGFVHDQVLRRPVDYGLSSWNRYIRYCRERGQRVIINHPNWSRIDPEIFLGIHGAFAFEIWNSDAINGGGCGTDEALWDYCLSRGKRIWALTGDDTHKYGPTHTSCGGGFTMVCAAEFSRQGLIEALKRGNFYPSTGPRIHDMRIVDDVLHMEFDPARQVRIIGGDLMAKGFTALPGEKISHLEWKIKSGLKYFRVQIQDEKGMTAWSQPVFSPQWDGEMVALREDPHTPIPEYQLDWQ